LAACLSEIARHEPAQGNCVLGLNLTVLSRGERVPFVSRYRVHGQERGGGRGGARRVDDTNRSNGCPGHHGRRRGCRWLRPGAVAAAPGHPVMASVPCPDCRALIEVPEGTRSGDLLECPSCAGHALRIREEAGRWSATIAHRVSCPACDQVITLADDVKPGDTIRCCGRRYRLTFEYGAFAAEGGSN
jgi:hypothetical protein